VILPIGVLIGVGILIFGNKTSNGLDFNFCVDQVLKHEGGYVNDPRDPGGETNFGISKRAYPTLNIKALTKEQAIEVYRRDYWARIDKTFPELNLLVFDSAVNQGVSAANAFVNTIKLMNLKTSSERIKYYSMLRENRYKANKNFQIFGKGWLARLNDVTIKSIA